jgi:2-alkenal reductase
MYAFAGLQTEDLTPTLARHFGLRVAHGALVDHVTPGGPAARAGLHGGSRPEQFQGEAVLAGGDVVVAIDGRRVAGATALVRIVTNSLRPGQTAVFRVLRGGSRRSFAVRLTARPPR